MKKLMFLFAILMVLVSCDDEGKKEEEPVNPEETAVTEAEVLADLDSLLAQQTFSQQSIDAIIVTAETFADNFPEHKRTPGILFTAAVNAERMGSIQVQSGRNGRPYFEKTVELADRITGNYPDFKDIRLVYELKASTLDIELERDEEATRVYEFLIRTYPQDTFNINNWQYRIEHIDEDPIDLIMSQVE